VISDYVICKDNGPSLSTVSLNIEGRLPKEPELDPWSTAISGVARRSCARDK